MPLPLTVSCSSKIQIGFTFLVPDDLGSPGKGPLNGCVCVMYVKHRVREQRGTCGGEAPAPRISSLTPTTNETRTMSEDRAVIGRYRLL